MLKDIHAETNNMAFHSIRETGQIAQIARLIAFFSGYFVFKIENVKVKVKYGFVLHTGLSFAI